MRSLLNKPQVLLCLGCFWIFGCGEKRSEEDNSYELLSEEVKRSPTTGLAMLHAAEGLEVNLFASEPVMHNPTNIDIDHRGRIWICEGYNYRADIVGNTPREEGDRILILEDTDGDGKADKESVFYQDKELDAPLGILVLGNKVIVSQSPYIWLLTDEDGDDKADKKEVIFQGIEGVEHDHGVHAVVFGPDGKFYFNYGNYGQKLLDREGNPVRDRNGKVIDFGKYQEGLVFRCDEDFTNIEVLGDNFRNPYELALDSYGTVWQSDNDDDGNKGVRMNYVMQGGNFGFKDEMTRASWQEPRTNMEDSIPYRHWFQNDPGVIPNLLHTGAGSPTGLTVYEGTLLPEKFRNQLIHCDAGQNVVRAYPVEKAGAGYRADFAPILASEKDQWFRPTDVSVAPDGSLIVSDWYDPSVGGHQIGDQGRGRLYRIAPPNSPYVIPSFDFTTPENALSALENPNLATRYLAWQALRNMGGNAEEALAKVFLDQDVDPRLRARCLWILGNLEQGKDKYFELGLKDSNPDLRITAIRLIEQKGEEISMRYLPQMVNDPAIQVRRETALALRHISSAKAASLWAALALAHDGKDKWYLEALGIAAKDKWDNFIAAYLKESESPLKLDAASKDIIWRSRSATAIPLLGDLAADPSQPISDRLRYFRAFDFHPESDLKNRTLINLMSGGLQNQEDDLLKWGLRHLNPSLFQKSTDAQKLVNHRLNQTVGTQEFIDLIARYNIKNEDSRLISLVLESNENDLKKKAAAIILKNGGIKRFQQIVSAGDQDKILAVLTALGETGSNEVVELLKATAMNEKLDGDLREQALKFMSTSNAGQDELLKLLAEDKLADKMKSDAAKNLAGARRVSVQEEAAKYLDQNLPTEQNHLPIEELITKTGDSAKGKVVFTNYCAVCHQVGGQGKEFGPDLSLIGEKLPKEGIYSAIFNPNAGISFGYEGYNVTLKDNSKLTGIILNRTDEELKLIFPGGNHVTYNMDEVVSLQKNGESMMPPGLQNAMTSEELIDLGEYLINLRQPK